ncbi:acyl-ACP desaturase [Nocardia uniformis]|uniref:Acyl-ACP desaturase n=1 Tax=Nocardia uniformis TaxID=53432 RepID=A0A849CF86_9NOCA|nr:acyl-ACP desaturase [Nocardia uniformis]
MHGIAYVTFQELATRLSHRNTGKVCHDPIAETMLQRIATDENLHMIFYRNICAAALDVAPDQTLRAITTTLMNFQMPGAGTPNFLRHGALMAKNGIYDMRQHLEDVMKPILRTWKIFERTDFTAEGEQTREELGAFLTKYEQDTIKFEERRDRLAAREVARRGPSTLLS